jgi:VIT1/CCC1 family predicted Fe2+/Mn2+ transporter
MSEFESQEQARRRLQLKGFTREQAAEVQQMASQMAQAQVQRSIAATQHYLSTVVSLMTSAFGLVAALAWNNAIQAWLHQYMAGNGVEIQFMYALVATFLAIIVIGILGFVSSRFLKNGRNLLAPPSGQ